MKISFHTSKYVWIVYLVDLTAKLHAEFHKNKPVRWWYEVSQQGCNSVPCCMWSLHSVKLSDHPVVLVSCVCKHYSKIVLVKYLQARVTYVTFQITDSEIKEMCVIMVSSTISYDVHFQAGHQNYTCLFTTEKILEANCGYILTWLLNIQKM